MKKLLIAILGVVVLCVGCETSRNYYFVDPLPLDNTHFLADIDLIAADGSVTTFPDQENYLWQYGPGLSFDGILGLCKSDRCELNMQSQFTYAMFGLGVREIFSGYVTSGDAMVIEEQHVFPLDHVHADIVNTYKEHLYNWRAIQE